jgi:hypothetical protein
MPKRIFPDEVYEYIINSNCLIATTRFNDKTYEENRNFQQEEYPCIYNCNKPVSQYISSKLDIYVLEMNNDKNCIMGIGVIRNDPIYNKYKIHDEEKYNIFSYVGKDRIDRSDFTKEEERMIKVFDILCFTGKRHSKRLVGIKCFPKDMLFNCRDIFDLVDFVCNCFKSRCVINKLKKI